MTISAPGPAPALPTAIFAARRDRLLAMIGDGVAVIPAAPELTQSRDTEIRYRQSSDFYYLTGFGEPASVAVLTPHDPTHRFTLFVRPRDPEREAWLGPRAGVDGARERCGADAAYPIDELAARLPALLRQADHVHYPVGTSGPLDARVMDAVTANRRSRQRTGSGPIGIIDLEASTGQMRAIKDAVEIERLRISAAIAAEGHSEVMRRSRPGVGEWELQAAFEGSVRAQGASGPAFLTIVGSGANGTVLHYVDNDRRLADGDLVLVDAGAEWGMYCSDISRTFPVSGRFLPHQRDVYDIVLAAEEAGIAAAGPGASLAVIHETVVRVLVQGLLDLRVLREGSVDGVIESGAYRQYYPHQTSHWLGLDVHDVGLYRSTDDNILLVAGMVFTVEPGLYFPADADGVPDIYRGMGIRLEDNVVILEDGYEVVTRAVPVNPDEIEGIVRNST